MPNPPAFEMDATNSGLVIHIMHPPTMGYLIPNISVIFVLIISSLLLIERNHHVSASDLIPWRSI
jgi:hypothetical protein